MGRILDAIRRKRSGPSTPPPLAESSSEWPLNNETDKENSSIVGNRSKTVNERKKEALRLGNREVLIGEDIGLDIEVTLSNSTSFDDERKKGSFETNESNDSEIVAVASSSESTILSNAAASVSEVTEVSDDGVLRDDEGNPIDPDEAELNMLRDDEGNIIDPKSLVVRDFLLDLSCESDEYYDDEGEHVDPKELISCIGIGDARLPIVTDSSTHSEGEDDADCECEVTARPLYEASTTESLSEAITSINRNITEREPTPRSNNRDAQNYENDEAKSRKSIHSTRRRRRRRSSAISASADEYVHIMFNNRLSTLQEEQSLSSPQNTDDSGDEADDESPAPSPRNQQKHQDVRGIGSFDEKFIKARWEYSLQMMNCGGSDASRAVIDVSVYCLPNMNPRLLNVSLTLVQSLLLPGRYGSC